MHRNQRGIATILLIILAAAVLSAAGYVGYSGFKAKNPKTTSTNSPASKDQSYTGKITLRECLVAGPGCGYRLETDNKNYALSGSSLSSYVGKPVNVTGKISQTSKESTIAVTSIDIVTSGTLKGQVTCNEKVNPEPCAARIELHSYGVDPNSGKYPQVINVGPNGLFSIELKPGSYTIVPEVKSGFPEFTPPIPNPISITAGQTTTVNIPYQSGLK